VDLDPAAAEAAEGRVQVAEQSAKAKTLLRQLEKRFGPVPPRARELVSQATVEQLDAWLDRVIDAGSLEDVLFEVH